MGFFTEMKMRYECVLAEMHEEKTGKYHHCGTASTSKDRLWNDIGNGNGDQDTSRKRDH